MSQGAPPAHQNAGSSDSNNRIVIESGENAGANSAGRKTRVKSSRKRRFSSSSINNNSQAKVDTDNSNMNGVTVTEGNPRMSSKIMSGKDGLGTAPMSQVAAQIMNVNGDAKATIASATMASMPAAYSSVGELNLRSNETVVDRFNSRTQKKALASQ